MVDQKHPSLEETLEFSLWLELLSLCLESGLDLIHALQEIIPLYPQSFWTKSFERFLSQLHEGKSKETALMDLEKYFAHSWIEAFTQSCIASHRYGIPLTQILRDQAQLLRSQTYHQLEKQIHVKQLKLLLPLFLFIFPAVMLMLMTPLFIQLFRMSF